MNQRPPYVFSSWLFLRLLGIIYGIAFVSLSGQLLGLVGSHGILPAEPLLQAAHQQLGFRAYWLLPTLCWLSASDRALQALCAIGIVSAGLLTLDVLPVLGGLLAWSCYLSLATVCREFLWFQWDSLLLEAGILGLLLSPWHILPQRPRGMWPPLSAVWLLRWLLFRLMCSSGIVKLTSGDTTWRRLTALTYHYETQPLPPWTAWYAHQLPAWFHGLSCVVLFVIEVGAPCLIFGSARMRRAAAAALIFLQALIILSGNYAFFNLLTVALCLLLIDDACWPHAWAQRFTPEADLDDEAWTPWKWRGFPGRTVIAVALVGLSTVPLGGAIDRRLVRANPLVPIYAVLDSFRIVNSYGLFAVMTTDRAEIIVEGSDDGHTWKAYEFRYKPGDLLQHPRFVAPHQPRLDWQMWFAALGSVRENPWFLAFCQRLLQGSPDVLRLLNTNPFPDHPPRYLQASLYDYHFTDPATRRKTGAWWIRTLRERYTPVLSLRGE